MYYLLKNQNLVIQNAIDKVGSYRKLSKIINIPRASLVRYKQGKALPEKRLNSITCLLGIKDKNKIILKELKENWRQIIGGKNCVKIKKAKGTFRKDLEKAQKMGALKLKEWHKKMKRENPREYYLSQYSKFKKIGGYKYKTENEEKVRNLLEKQVADTLRKLKIKYEYEPLIKVGRKYFFPDFLIGNKIIIECTAWKGEEKAYKLKEKIEHLKKDYKVYILIPKNLYSYYKILNNHLILGVDEFVPIAQTF